MTSIPRVIDGPSDAEMIVAARAGDLAAFGILYSRHLGAAQRLARQLVRSPSEVDDLVSEAFAKVLDSLRGGGGPDTAFRAYLLTTLRNLWYDRLRRDRRLEYSGDLTDLDPGVPFVDTAVQELESQLVSRAFASLPERWQAVLWHTEVEGESPAQVAPILGLSPNAVSALAYRAREGLRQAYLQVHLQDSAGENCRDTVERLGAWARHGLSRRDKTQVDAHLAGCARCRQLAEEVADVNHGLLGVVAVLVLGAPWAAGYLASGAAAPAVAVGTAAAAGGAVAAGAGAAAGLTAAAKIGIVASLLHLPGMAKLGAGVGTAVVAGGLVVSLSHAPAKDLRAAPPVPATTLSAPASPGTGPAPARTRAPGGGEGPAGAPGSSGSPGTSGSAAPGTPGQPSSPGGGHSTSASPAPQPTPTEEIPTIETSTGPPGPRSGPGLSAGQATPNKTLVAGKQAQLAIPVNNEGSAEVTNLVAHVVLPDGIALRGADSTDAANPGKPKKWRCDKTADGATCRLSVLADGGALTMNLKISIAADTDGGTLFGDITADAEISAEIPATDLPVVPK
jgi:RNA polymerase sigma factor (sigma-70 family)